MITVSCWDIETIVLYRVIAYLLAIVKFKVEPEGISCKILPQSFRKLPVCAGRIQFTKCSSLFINPEICAPPCTAGLVLKSCAGWAANFFFTSVLQAIWVSSMGMLTPELLSWTPKSIINALELKSNGLTTFGRHIDCNSPSMRNNLQIFSIISSEKSEPQCQQMSKSLSHYASSIQEGCHPVFKLNFPSRMTTLKWHTIAESVQQNRGCGRAYNNSKPTW